MAIQTSYGLYFDTQLEATWGSDFSIDFVVPLELVSQWRRCGLISDFLAQYHSFRFTDQKKALSILSTIINELLENGVKFCNDRNKLVTLSLRHEDNAIRIETTNTTNENNAARLDNLILQLSQNDPEELFFQHLETLASDPPSDASGLGILTIIKDYDGKAGIKIVPKIDQPESYEVSVTVSVDLATLEAI